MSTDIAALRQALAEAKKRELEDLHAAEAAHLTEIARLRNENNALRAAIRRYELENDYPIGEHPAL